MRLPNNAGSWYAGSERSLKKQLIDECFLHSLGPGKIPKLDENGPRNILGLLCPHAGYMYSGPITAHSYNALAEDGKPENIIIIGPNHTGLGSGVAIWPDGIWRTPLGDVQVNSELAKKIQKASNYIDIDEQAHIHEHSIELQLPFLQLLYETEFSIVPISMMLQDLEVALDVAQAIAKSAIGTNVIVIASSDMTHYETQEAAEKKDSSVIQAIEGLDEEKIFSTVEKRRVTMCGVAPTIAMTASSKILGAKQGFLLKYATSGDIIGDKSAVVGYCSMAIKKV